MIVSVLCSIANSFLFSMFILRLFFLFPFCAYLMFVHSIVTHTHTHTLDSNGRGKICQPFSTLVHFQRIEESINNEHENKIDNDVLVVAVRQVIIIIIILLSTTIIIIIIR